MNPSRRIVAFSNYIYENLAAGLLSVQALILIPLYIQILGPQNYGIWLSTGEILSWMLVTDLGIPNLIAQRTGVACSQNDYRRLGSWIFTGSIALIFTAIIVSLIGIGIALAIPYIFKMDKDVSRIFIQVIIICSLATSGTILNNLWVGYSRGVQNTRIINRAHIVSIIVSFGVTYYLLRANKGLYSIAGGFIARTIILWVGSIVYYMRSVPSEVKQNLRWDKDVFRDIKNLAPISTLGNLSYVALNQSELTILAVLIKPETAALYLAARKAADLSRVVADSLSHASYGGFSNLVGSGDIQGELPVYQEIFNLRNTISISLMTSYIAVNSSFLKLWAGQGFETSLLLNVSIALQGFFAGSSYLANYLFKASGEIEISSRIMATEAICRIISMIILVPVLGIYGISIGSAVVAAIAWVIIEKKIREARHRIKLSSAIFLKSRIWILRVGLLAVGSLTAKIVVMHTWLLLILVSSAIAGVAFIAQFVCDSGLRQTAHRFLAGQTLKKMQEIV